MEKEILQTYTKEICPGVYLERYYTDTTKVYGNDPVEEKWTLRIDYCLAGRFEAEFTENRHSYIESGQFAINTTDYDIVSSYFPGNIYQGLSLIFYEEKMKEKCIHMLQSLDLNLRYLNQRVNRNTVWFVDRAEGKLKNTFQELFFSVDEEKEDYLWLKILEILYFLKDIVYENKKEFAYFSDNVTYRIKEAVRQALSKDSCSVNLKELIQKTEMNPAYFYRLFKQTYGASPAKYFREYRLSLAASQLVNTKKLIQQIAMEAGYDNSSKFAEAFSRIYGCSPRMYRKNINMEHLG